MSKLFKKEQPDFIGNFAYKLSIKGFFNLFDRLGLTPNQISCINFFVNNLLAVFFFSRGTYLGNLLGLFFCALSAIFDYIDGAIAQTKQMQTKLGSWLDPMLDFMWQNMLVCSIIYGIISAKGVTFWLPVGLLTIVGVVISNHMGCQFNKSFGLDAFRKGSPDFTRSIETNKLHLIEIIAINIIIPTKFIFILLFTLRYFIILGAIFNIMPLALFLIMIFSLIKAIVSVTIYALFLCYQDNKILSLRLFRILEAYYHSSK